MRRSLLLWFAALAALLFSGCSAPALMAAAPDAVPARLVSPAEFAAEMDRGERTVVNVHTPDEGSIAGTDTSVPFDQIEARVAELPQDRAAPLALYCKSGRMSAIAVETLSRMGYTDLVDLRGGMVAWKADGRALVPPLGS